MSKGKLEDVKDFWDHHPLGSYEIPFVPGTEQYFQAYEEIRQQRVERSKMHIWKFNELPGKKVLDVGCGIGFLVVNYARGGADVTGLDISTTEVELTRKILDTYGLRGTVIEGNAEELPFPDGTFDFVSSSGALQFCPNIQRAIDEIYRVLRRGGEATISVYYSNIYLRKYSWRITAFLARVFFRRFPGRRGFKNASSLGDFVAMFDGIDNPYANAFAKREFRNILRNFRILEEGVYHIPLRFLPFHRLIPGMVFRVLERYLGVMLYYRVAKDEPKA